MKKIYFSPFFVRKNRYQPKKDNFRPISNNNTFMQYRSKYNESAVYMLRYKKQKQLNHTFC